MADYCTIYIKDSKRWNLSTNCSFVAPILTLVSIFLPTHRTFFFESLVLGLGVFVTIHVTKGGESNWLEGVQLLAIYVLAAIGFFLL